MSRSAAGRSAAAERKACRDMLVMRAALEREAMRDATQDLQIASERIARIAAVGVKLLRQYWLPIGVVLAGGLFRRARPFLRFFRTGLAVYQTVRLLRR